MEDNSPLSVVLGDLRAVLTRGPDPAETGGLEGLTVRSVVEILQARGIGALMVVFALFLALPSGILPGLNTVFAIPLIILAAQLALGRTRAWLPARVLAHRLDPVHTTNILGRLLPWLRRLERILKPRLPWVISGHGRRITGLIALALALFAAIPVPLTHTVPGFALLIFSAGLATGDGLVAIAGLSLGILYAVLLPILLLGIVRGDMVRHR